jgi:hypothetical protein
MTLNRRIQRLEKHIPLTTDDLFPYLDHLLTLHPALPTTHPLLSTPPSSFILHPSPFVTALTAYLQNQATPDQEYLLNTFPFDPHWQPIHHLLDGRWPNHTWLITYHDALYLHTIYQDCLDAFGAIFWELAARYSCENPPSEQTLIYQQFCLLPPEERQEHRQSGRHTLIALYRNAPYIYLNWYHETLDLAPPGPSPSAEGG